MIDKYLEPYLQVDIIEPTQNEIDKYYEKTGEFKLSSSSQKSVIIFKKAIIKETFNEKKYPVNSEWMMGESPGIKGMFFGEPVILIQEKDLYKRLK